MSDEMIVHAPADWEEPVTATGDVSPEFVTYRLMQDQLALWFALHPGQDAPPAHYITDLYQAQQAWITAKASRP